MHESAIVQSRRHHRVGLQPGGEVLLGRLRLLRWSASRTRRPIASAASSASTRRGRPARSAGSASRAARCSRSSTFEPQQPPHAVAWNRVGLTHISFNVRGIRRWYDYLVSKGVEIVSPPEQSPRGHSLFFAKDFDGNLIEIIDLGYMYYVLGWLGPLGGWIFRRGMYKKYYE